MLYLLIIVVVVCVAGLLFLKLNPVFGGSVSKQQKEAFSKLDNYVDGKFENEVPAKMDMGISNIFSMLKEMIVGGKDRNPSGQLPISPIDWEAIHSEQDSLTWLGHSAYILSMDNKKILLDPMLGRVASPVTWVGSKRYSEDLLPLIDKMPQIDAVLLTHDHYDHLDYPSIQKLKSKVNHFFVPLGVGNHLTRWGVPQENITELNWWDETEYEGLKLALTPSKHFSGRGLWDRNSTLWGGWVILGKQTRFYSSGDGGYDAHFKAIGKKYGPFDMTLIEGGQYDKRWSWVHMTPEEAVQAHLDVNGKNMKLMHWGAFTLAYHSWTDPIDRAIVAAEKANVNLIAPPIGETVPLTREMSVPITSWWKQ
ncbi:MBL fold metallo-hydrolase [Paenibacillus sp. N1-5-1-14]|uniref:MBL fold metallo-hydrolase n=1 Tax=Paenibacillus radicibacter TaxID=2972488 RepID=UPI0021595BCA|nr:MBL fold metallo-hydrolase [Paenibacillus radicibacter]MCR8643400.1 MBL fold metallo-hydrolase [Paenibacillus radicibacter]